MKPAQICTGLKQDNLNQIIGELSSPQIKAVLKEGGVKVKLPGGYVSNQKRRKVWTERICNAIEGGNDEVAGEMIQQWLLHHRRQMLIDLLDRLEVKHKHGETDESFLVTKSPDTIKAAAGWLLGNYDHAETTVYLRYIAFQQRSTVFDGWEELSQLESAVKS